MSTLLRLARAKSWQRGAHTAQVTKMFEQRKHNFKRAGGGSAAAAVQRRERASLSHKEKRDTLIRAKRMRYDSQQQQQPKQQEQPQTTREQTMRNCAESLRLRVTLYELQMLRSELARDLPALDTAIELGVIRVLHDVSKALLKLELARTHFRACIVSRSPGSCCASQLLQQLLADELVCFMVTGYSGCSRSLARMLLSCVVYFFALVDQCKFVGQVLAGKDESMKVEAAWCLTNIAGGDSRHTAAVSLAIANQSAPSSVVVILVIAATFVVAATVVIVAVRSY